MIETRKLTRYRFVCEECTYKSILYQRTEDAERDERRHECGVHREEHDSTGGYRGILGGYNRHCICGARYTSESGMEKFQCPRDTTTAAPKETP